MLLLGRLNSVSGYYSCGTARELHPIPVDDVNASSIASNRHATYSIFVYVLAVECDYMQEEEGKECDSKDKQNCIMSANERVH